MMCRSESKQGPRLYDRSVGKWHGRPEVGPEDEDPGDFHFGSQLSRAEERTNPLLALSQRG